MFETLLGKKKDIDSEDDVVQITARISKMNLSEMRNYVNNKVTNLAVSKDGILEVLKKLTNVDEQNSKLYLQADDMDSKKKKGFDLVILISKNIHMDVEIVELLQKFTVLYKELISAYDTENKDIYTSRLTDVIGNAVDNVNKYTELNRKTNVLGE